MNAASSEGGTTPPGTREDLALIRERVPHYVEGSFVADSIEWGTHADDCPGCAIGEALARVADELERLASEHLAMQLRIRELDSTGAFLALTNAEAIKQRGVATEWAAELAAKHRAKADALLRLCDAIHDLPEQIEGEVLAAYQEARALLSASSQPSADRPVEQGQDTGTRHPTRTNEQAVEWASRDRE